MERWIIIQQINAVRIDFVISSVAFKLNGKILMKECRTLGGIFYTNLQTNSAIVF